MTAGAMIEFLQRDGSPARAKVARYPGGEYRVEGEDLGTVALVHGADADELVVLAVWANNVRRSGGSPVGLIPYLPAARADHEDRAEGFDAAAYARLINAAELDRVVCVDPHSPVMPSMIENCTVIEAADVIAAESQQRGRNLAGVIVPDEGARDRVRRVADVLGIPTVQAHKHRDFETGALSWFSCDPLPGEGVFLVVDDICDGGGTFRGLAAATGIGRHRLHLWVTHGIFSGAAFELIRDYATITTTDSHPGHRNMPTARVVPLLPHLLRRTTT